MRQQSFILWNFYIEIRFSSSNIYKFLFLCPTRMFTAIYLIWKCLGFACYCFKVHSHTFSQEGWNFSCNRNVYVNTCHRIPVVRTCLRNENLRNAKRDSPFLLFSQFSRKQSTRFFHKGSNDWNTQFEIFQREIFCRMMLVWG